MVKEPSKIPFDVHKSLQNLISSYIYRQQHVVQAMIHFRPDLIRGFHIDKVLNINIEEQYHFFVEHYLGNDSIFNGVWQNEWIYLLHGYGCRLIHIETGEPLEWDISHPLAFYLGWFATQLEWRRDTDFDNQDVLIYWTWANNNGGNLQEVLDQLIQEKQLIKIPVYSGWFLASMRQYVVDV